MSSECYFCFVFFFKREILNNSSAGHREGKLKETKNDAISAAKKQQNEENYDWKHQKQIIKV